MRVFRGIPVLLFGALRLPAQAGFVLPTAGVRQQSESQTEWPGYEGGQYIAFALPQP